MKEFCYCCGERKTKKDSKLETFIEVDWKSNLPLANKKKTRQRCCKDCLIFIKKVLTSAREDSII